MSSVFSVVNNKIMNDDRITQKIIQCAIKVHKALGPGLLESAYQECLFFELNKQEIKVVKEKPLPLIYDGVKLDYGYRIDLFVEDRIVVELKSVEMIHEIHMAQILTYLKLADRRIGLLINFNSLLLKRGIKRVVNGY